VTPYNPRMHKYKGKPEGPLHCALSYLHGKPLSAREMEALLWLCKGMSNKEIATVMGGTTTDNSVKSLTKQIFSKLGVQTRTAAAMRAIKEGWFIP
jgi:DNA-binding NarL/FixJ family response regulator